MGVRHRDRPETSPRSASAVLVAPALAPSLDGLAGLLADELAVLVGPPLDDQVALVDAAGLDGFARLRQDFPGAVLLVIDRGQWAPDPATAVAYLEAGADGYLRGPALVEVAAHVRAVVRRRRLVAGRHDDRDVEPRPASTGDESPVTEECGSTRVGRR